MAYDEDLANRIRELVAGEPGVTDQRMFDGLAFLVGARLVGRKLASSISWYTADRDRSSPAPPPRATCHSPDS